MRSFTAGFKGGAAAKTRCVQSALPLIWSQAVSGVSPGSFCFSKMKNDNLICWELLVWRIPRTVETCGLTVHRAARAGHNRAITV